ncbi:hypothetical protein GH714_000231 [Hevea brasiliensis]|uniref:Uncharacterized protein n=1 Tax=Hevea brasiliensis TaxID=3981 RepID=A0A6A6M692_HEVBR|nr:hypothetical protein GH714_000231 [Hevea brasiliensis]
MEEEGLIRAHPTLNKLIKIVKGERAYCIKDEGDEESTLLLTCNAGEEKDQEAWFLDSGASNHMTGKKNLFVTLDESVKSSISFGDNTKVAIKGKGDILIQTKNGAHQFISQVKENGNMLIVCLYIDDLIFTRNSPLMFEEFKKEMAEEFDMTDIELMSYYLGIEVKQSDDGIFISQKAYAVKILKEFNMENCQLVSTPVERRTKLSRYDDCEKVNPTLYRKLVGNLRYLTCTMLDILYGVGLISQYMEALTTIHMKAAKRILHYVKGTMDYGLFYSASNNFRLVGYSDSDWGGDIDDRKSTTGFLFFIGEAAFTWSLKNQPIMTLSTCEAEYIAAASCVYHAIWL